VIPSRTLLSVTALLLALGGAALLFAPEAAARVLVVEPTSVVWPWQMLGAAWLGFASLNWASRGSVIGGIYARPLVSGNFTHFFVAALVVARPTFGSAQGAGTWTVFVIVALLVIAYGQRMFFGAPEREMQRRG
jgi:hypothetical protein